MLSTCTMTCLKQPCEQGGVNREGPGTCYKVIVIDKTFTGDTFKIGCCRLCIPVRNQVPDRLRVHYED